MVMFWCELGIFRTTQLENSAGSLNHGHDSSFATLQNLNVLGPGAVRCFVTCDGCTLIAVAQNNKAGVEN